MQTIKELYWEAMRAPADPVNFKRNPYQRENIKKKLWGKTKAERDAKLREAKAERIEHIKAVDAAVQQDAELGIGTPLEHKERRVGNAKARRKLGFIDMETDADGNSVLSEDGIGVEDKVMEDLEIRSTTYQKAVQEQRDRKKIKIITPVQGISRAEYEDGKLRPDEHFKDI